MYMLVLYGTHNQSIDVTHVCFSTLLKNKVITIPSLDGQRAKLFTDPLPNVLKSIFIQLEPSSDRVEYDHSKRIKINTESNTVETQSDAEVDAALAQIHAKLQFRHGYLHDELPEQKMVVRSFTGKEKVLEIGANIGRNSLVIASMLDDPANLVSLECVPETVVQLKENRTLNSFNFHVECGALSKRKLIQRHQCWTTVPSDVLLPNHNWVNTFTWSEFKAKYDIEFDTLVLDCEGAFYYILMDMPEILDTITFIVMENDYTEIGPKEYIDDVLTKKGFYKDYVEAGGWGPCYSNFYEIWKRDIVL
jgi:FkbM family methyltransferase